MRTAPIDRVCRRLEPSGTAHFEFVQLKEVVPHELNPHANLQEVLDRLPER